MGFSSSTFCRIFRRSTSEPPVANWTSPQSAFMPTLMEDTYALLPAGASMGDGYGPMLVAKRRMGLSELRQKRIAVPGKMTSAFLALLL